MHADRVMLNAMVPVPEGSPPDLCMFILPAGDVQVMLSHIVYDQDVATELHGRALVGLPPNSALL